jgi:hypothetical protein
VQALPMQPEVAATPVVAPADQPPASADLMSNDMLPIAGAAGLGILALAGAGLAVRRRRRRAQEAEDAAWQEEVESAADPVAEPAMVVEPQHEPAMREPAFVAAPAPSPVPVADLTPVEGPTTDLPEGFDLSRFSPNVQAAYRGPTEDNPSLSLKHRLRKASAMDQMERHAEAEAETVPAPKADAPAAKPAVADPAKEDFMFSRAKKPSTRPAFTN